MKQQNNITKYILELQNPKTDKLAVISDALCYLSYDELKVFNKRAPRLFHSLVKLNYLKRQSYGKVGNVGYTFGKGDDVCEYIGTLAYIFEQHRESLNLFVELFYEYEKSLLSGKYEDCKKILNKINTQVSYSYWGTDSEIKLCRMFEHLTQATKVYNKLFKENRRLSSLCFWSFKTSAVDVPFDTDVNHLLRRMQDQYAKEVFISHCFPYKDIPAGRSVSSDSSFSIIDLYCGFIYSLDILPKEIIHDARFLRYLKIIANTINDYRLKKRLCLITNELEGGLANSEERQQLLVDYFSGNFNKIIQSGEQYLQDNPADISMLDLYVKSCIIKGKEISDAPNESSLASKIQNYYYHYLINDENSDVYRKKLRNLCEVWYTFPSIKHLYWLVDDRSQNNITLMSKNYWRSSYGLNIQDVSFFSGIDEKRTYILQLSSALSNIFNMLENEKSFNDQVDFWNFQIWGKTGEGDILNDLTELIRGKSIQPFSRNSICSYVINQHFATGQIYEAVELFSDITTDESTHLVLTLDQQLVDDFLETDADSQYANPLDFAIFYTYVNAIPYKRYLSMRRFLKQKNVQKVSEIELDGSPKLKALLEYVADRQVLSLQRVFKNSNEVIDERILILKNLYDYYKDKQYLEEISALSKMQTINGLVQQVDDSKIYVDVENIKNKELKEKEFNVLFDIFKNTSDKVKVLENKNPELYAILSVLQKSGYSSFALITGDESQEIDYKYSLFEKLYLEARDKFLFDPKYGLDYYLSTRIRHGTIDNQLRNHLQEYRLVTNLDENGGEYTENLYWTNRLGNAVECNKILKSFSESADALIFTLKDERIQIKTEDEDSKHSAVFDFSKDKLKKRVGDLLLNCSEADFDACVSLIFDDLWEHAEDCLKEMKVVLEETHNQMRALLDKLYSNISKVSCDAVALKDFKDSITLCQTQLQADFNKVQGWFQRKDVSTFDFSILQAFDASLYAINRINQEKLSVQKDINSPSSFKGQYFGAMHDLFHDILKNVLDYQKKRRNVNKEVTASITEDGDMLLIEISNPVADQDIPQLKNTIEEANGYSLLVSKGRSRIEGKSGFLKIFNIVCNVFDSPENRYQNKIEDCKFTVDIAINISKLRSDEDTNC